jgi:hypothetical protein
VNVKEPSTGYALLQVLPLNKESSSGLGSRKHTGLLRQGSQDALPCCCPAYARSWVMTGPDDWNMSKASSDPGLDHCFPKWGMSGKFLTSAKHVSSCIHSRVLKIGVCTNHPNYLGDIVQRVQSEEGHSSQMTVYDRFG